MPIHVRTTVFEGPFDLLLQLITRHQVEVTDIGLTDVVTEYLAFIDEMERLDIEVTSEFLLIAATLVQLKMQSLLPRPGDLDLDEELALVEERDRLLSRLLACVTFKDVAAVLSRRLQICNRYVPRVSGLDQMLTPNPEIVQLSVDADDLATIGLQVLARVDEAPDLDHLDLDLPSVETAMEDLQTRIKTSAFASFDELTEHLRRPVEVAAYFLALLEMARWGLIEVTQPDWQAGIEVRRRTDVELDFTSEWAS